MPRVHCKKAGKDYPLDGIKKGDTYYSWSFFRQNPTRSLTPPKASQLTQAPYGQALAAMEGLHGDVDGGVLSADSTLEDVQAMLETAADEITNVAEEYRESAANIEDGFGHATEGSEMREQYAEELDSFADEVRDLSIDEPPALEDTDEDEDIEDEEERQMDQEERHHSAMEEWCDTVKDEVGQLECPTPEF